MDNVANYIIKIGVQNQQAINNLTGQTQQLTNKVNGASAAFSKLGKMAVAAVSIYKIVGFVKQATAAYEMQAVAETKLAKVMQNTMGATQEETKSILELASAQQKLGVIGDEVQLSGAQELATYLTKADSLKKLLPIMNDMLAQQYGLNASQEQAIQIGSMMGKVMDGQVGALSRYGYKFSEAQEHILKFGTEEQRAATLAQVVASSVGGVNAALAQTPEGRMKQIANNMGDLHERMGKVFIAIKGAFLPAIDAVGSAYANLVSWFEANSETIMTIVRGIGTVFSAVFNTIAGAISVVVNVFSWLVNVIKSGIPVIVTALTMWVTYMAIANAKFYLFTMQYYAYIVATKAAALATKVWTGVQWALNAALSANPVGIIIAGVIALIALITYLIYKTDGWGKQWESLTNFIKLSWQYVVEALKLDWLNVQNFFLAGIELIEKAWYKLKSLWDKEGAKEGLDRINSEAKARAEELAAQRGKVEELRKAAGDALTWELSWNSERSLSDIVGGLKKKVGIDDPNAPGAAVNAGGGLSSGPEMASSTEAVVTGGTKSTNITINIGNLVENMTFSKSETKQNINDMQDRVLDAMLRVVNMSQSVAT